MTPHKSLGQEVKNSTANWGEDEEGCRSRRLQWLGLEHSQHDVVNTSVIMKSTSVISGQSLISQKAHPIAQWPFPSIGSTGLFLIQQKKNASTSHAQIIPFWGLLFRYYTAHELNCAEIWQNLYPDVRRSSQHLIWYILSHTHRTESCNLGWWSTDKHIAIQKLWV